MSSTRATSSAGASRWRAEVTATESSDAGSRRSRLVSVLLGAASARSEGQCQVTGDAQLTGPSALGRTPAARRGQRDRVGQRSES